MKKIGSIILSVILYLTGTLTLIICGIIYMLLSIAIPRRYLCWYVKLAGRAVLLGFGQWLIIEGNAPKKLDRPCLYLPNHESLLDVFMMCAAIQESYVIVAAEYHFKIPLWRWLLKRVGCVPIERKKIHEAVNTLKHVEERLKQGESAVIFWEGTRSRDGRLQQPKKGAFHTAKRTRVPLVPCGIVGAFEAQNRSRFSIRPGKITWRFGEQIWWLSLGGPAYSELSVDELSQLVKEKVAELTGEDDK